jgi:GNAT superfamily N-acetyltransferase
MLELIGGGRVMQDGMQKVNPIVHIQNPSEELLRQIGRLRFTVWVDREPSLSRIFPNHCWLEDADRRSEHWVVTDQASQVCASARLSVATSLQELPYGTILSRFIGSSNGCVGLFSRLVVRADARRRGIASRLDAVRYTRACTHRVSKLFVIAESFRARQLSRLGFRRLGSTLDIPPWTQSENIPLMCDLTEERTFV